MEHTDTTALARQQNLSSERLLQIIQFLSKQSDPQRLIDISTSLQITQPTTLRYLKTLIATSYAFQDPSTGGYALTWKLCQAADELKINRNLRAIVSPYLTKLSRELDMGALLATEDDGKIMYLDVVSKPGQAFNSLMRIGISAPIHTTGSGKILLSGMPDSKISRIIRTNGLEKLTPNTITTEERLMEEIYKIRKLKYAQDNEECEIGHCCVSIALTDYTNRIIAAISLFEESDLLTEERIQNALPVLLHTGNEISYLLGHENGQV